MKVMFFLNILRQGAGMINREISYAEELANKMGKTLDHHSDKYDPPFNYTNIPECNNFYYAFVCEIFGTRFKN